MSFYIRITAAELVVGNNCTTFISKPVKYFKVVMCRTRSSVKQNEWFFIAGALACNTVVGFVSKIRHVAFCNFHI